jgi:hypothetical protein
LVIFALFLEVMQTKNQFIKILHGYLSSTEEDAWQIQALKEAYPYSQVLHALAARLSKDHHLPTEQADLQRAAVHAGDRAVLKDIMTRVHTPQVSVDETPVAAATTTVEEHAVAEDVMNELNRLHELRQNFESLFEAETARQSETQTETASADTAPAETPSAESEQPDTETPATPTEPKKPKGRVGRKPGRAKAQRIIELARALNAQQQSSAENENEQPKKSTGQKKNAEGPDDLILDAIEQSKKKLAPGSERQQEQMEIIDEFINASPSISNLRSKSVPVSPDDLSQVKAGEFGEHLVSETLVEILINQGKKERAIEVLKKLIWKFPQKKAYFAAQIEDLRK